MRRTLIPLLLLCASFLEANDQLRKPKDEADLRFWLENMWVHHRFTAEEIGAVTGLKPEEIESAVAKYGWKTPPPKREANAPLLVLPYPGGRHPRIGFLDGAVAPQRETKLSVFTPWDAGSYVVVDVPEAVFCNLGLIYLAHTHVPTLWTERKIELPQLEWERRADGSFAIERPLPNGIAFGVHAVPKSDHVAMRMWLRNGTAEPLTNMRVQMCAMLKGARGFDAQTNDNKVFDWPFAAAHDGTGQRWIIHGWQPIQRTWGNPPCPCLHADPKIPDCPPGQTQEIHGWLSFYEGADVKAEMKRIAEIWKPAEPRADQR